MFKEFQLPDGTLAENVNDIERYIKQNDVALASDYSGEYLNTRRFFNEKARRDEIRADFIYNVKKELWLND